MKLFTKTKQSILFLLGILLLSLLFASFFPFLEGMDEGMDEKALVKDLHEDIVKHKAKNVEEDELLEDEEKKINKLENYLKVLEGKEDKIVNDLKGLLNKLSGEEKQTVQQIISEVADII